MTDDCGGKLRENFNIIPNINASDKTATEK